MKTKSEGKTFRNPIAVAMMERYGKTTTKMRDRRDRRAKDARNDPRRQDW